MNMGKKKPAIVETQDADSWTRMEEAIRVSRCQMLLLQGACHHPPLMPHGAILLAVEQLDDAIKDANTAFDDLHKESGRDRRLMKSIID
jgi:hypothetical protein